MEPMTEDYTVDRGVLVDEIEVCMSVSGDAIVGDVAKDVVVLEIGRILEDRANFVVEGVDERDVVCVECLLMCLKGGCGSSSSLELTPITSYLFVSVLKYLL